MTICQRRQLLPTPVPLPGKSHGWRTLVDCSPWGREEWDMTEQLHFHFSLLYIEEGNGNPLQCSCLENPRDGGAWWAAVYGVAQSWTRLKWLSSSSMTICHNKLWKILKELGIPGHLICLLRNLYAGQEATVRTGHGTTDWFQIGKGVSQGCIMSPCLFNFYAEYIVWWSTNWNQDCWEKYQ